MINNFKYIKDNENPIGHMLLAISNNKERPPANIIFKIINTVSKIEISPCAVIYFRFLKEREYPDSVDVFHRVGIEWKRMDCLEYPNDNWTWEKIQSNLI